jgi:hypothetical protein
VYIGGSTLCSELLYHPLIATKIHACLKLWFFPSPTSRSGSNSQCIKKSGKWTCLCLNERLRATGITRFIQVTNYVIFARAYKEINAYKITFILTACCYAAGKEKVNCQLAGAEPLEKN